MGSGVRVVGSALVMSSLGALGHPWAKENVAWRCGCTRRARSLDGGTLGTLAFKGWAEEKQLPKDHRQEQATKDKEGRWAGPGSSRSGGAPPLECTKQSGVIIHTDSRVPPCEP